MSTAKIFFSDNLKTLRGEKGETQASIASLVNKRATAISSWENGLSEPSFQDLVILSDYFGVSIGDLIGKNINDGNLNTEKHVHKNTQKGNLNSNRIGNLNRVYDQNEVPIPRYFPAGIDYNFGLPKVISTNNSGNENIIHVPVRARAGYLTGYGDPEFVETLPAYTLPGLHDKSFRSFEVEGLSMRPTLQPRDWVVGEWVENVMNIRDNRIHIVVTKNDGVLIKRVLNRISERGKIYLKSDTIQNRADYPTIEMDPSDVAEIWYARMRFGTDFSEPSEVFTKINDLEIQMMEVKKRLLELQ